MIPFNFSSIYTGNVLVFLIWCWYPVIGYPLMSSSDVTASVQGVRVSIPKPLAVGVKVVIVPHDGCASFWCYYQTGVLTVVTEIIGISLLASFR